MPRVWPSLREVDFWVDTRRPVLNALVAAAARSRLMLSTMRAAQVVGRRLTKRFGSTSGGFGIELEDANGARHSSGSFHSGHSYIVAVAPAVLAARRIAAGTFGSSGLVPADRQVDPEELVRYLRGADIRDFGISDSASRSG